jgi:uncharacterized protein
MQKALESNQASTATEGDFQQIKVTPEKKLAMLFSALLHDADDKKYFPDSKDYPNAARICQLALKSQTKFNTKTIEKEMKRMIAYVSASDNGNSIPKRAVTNPELLWARYSDRLEAIGPIGAVRCFQYNEEKGRPRSVETTPKPKTREEVWALVTPERFEKYMKTKTSDSMMDHYFDKLLQIAVFDPKVVKNEYLC